MRIGRIKTHFLLSHDLRGHAHDANLALCRVDRPADAHFPAMLKICSQQGLDEDWCREQLENGAGCVVAMDGKTPAGVGLVTDRPFHVEEIAHTIDPRPAGCYLFATFVAPSHRGRRIQRALDEARFAWGRSHGLTTAYALVESSNAASLRSHRASGFRPCMRIERVDLPSASLFYFRRMTTRPAVPSFSAERSFGPRRLHLISAACDGG